MNTNRRSSRQEVGSGRNAMTEDEHPEMENPFRLSNGRQRLCVVVGGVFILKSIGGAVIDGSIWMLCAQTPTAACLNPWLYMPWSLTSIFRSGIHGRLHSSVLEPQATYPKPYMGHCGCPHSRNCRTFVPALLQWHNSTSEPGFASQRIRRLVTWS